MFQLTEKYFKLIDYYKDMATNGYQRNDGIFINKTYGTAEPIKFKEQIKSLAGHFKCKTALDYGSGGSDLNIEEVSEGISFKDYVGLKKFINLNQQEILRKMGSLILSYHLMY